MKFSKINQERESDEGKDPGVDDRIKLETNV